MKLHPLCVALVAAFSSGAHADDTGDRQSLIARLDRLSVVGSAEKADDTAGSAHYIDAEDLATFNYADVHRVLRRVPGVYLIDEEGFGLRPNIGIRGSGTDRNSRITVMEDGVLIAPAPYAAAAAYYFPTMARMNAVEVRKGSSAIKAGPRTTGGAINLISTPIPTELSGLVDYAFGSDASQLAHAWVGGASERTGFLLETVQQNSDGFKRLDNGGDTGYTLEDYLGKFRITSAPDADRYQELELKLGRTEQDSDETYLGLTDGDFAAHPNRRYAASQLDNIRTEHEHASLRHSIEFSPSVDLTTVAYRNDFARNWYKIDSINGRSISAVLAAPENFSSEYAWLRGATSPDNALVLRNNNRRYYAEGVQSVLGWSLGGERMTHQIEAGLRWHRDDEDRFQDDDRYRMENGRMVLTTDGAAGTQDNRVGEAEAWSFFLQDEIRIGRWLITPGLRHESIDLTQTRYARRPDGRDSAPTAISETSVDAWIPGIGVLWQFADSSNLFASVHRGFNPPGPGATAESEESINAEVGLRHEIVGLQVELIGFWNDYDNLVGTCTASTGGNCDIGDQFDGGEATVRGFEAALSQSLAHGDLRFPFELAYTYTDAEFDTSFDSAFEEWTTVIAGDELPYLPQHQLHLGAGIEAVRWRANVGLNYLDEMRTRAGQGDIPRAQRTDSAWVLDLSAAYRLTDYAEIYARVENAADETYIVARRPAGARPGRPRSSFVGVRVNF